MSRAGSPGRPGPGLLDAIGAIALNTAREAIRDRILYLLLAFALVVIVGGRFLSLMTVGSEEKIIKDLGLAAISVFGTLTSVFVGVSLVYKEIDRRTVFTLLANPVRRWQFVTGKYVGLLAVLTVNVVVMGAALVVLLLLRGETAAGLVPAIWLILVELTVITAFAILFSTYTNPILSALGTMAVYVVGHLSWSFDLLARRLPEGAGRWICHALHAIVPNLDRLDIKAAAVHGLALAPGTVAWATLYGLVYAAVIVGLACAVFERREFV